MSSRRADELKKLVEEYKAIKETLSNIRLDINNLTKEQANLLKRVKLMETALMRAGIITGVHVLKTSEVIYMYFWVTKSNFKVIKKIGIIAAPVPMTPDEREIFYGILRKRGINFPHEVVWGRLTPEPYQSPQVAIRKVLLKAAVPINEVFVGDWDLFEDYTETTNKEERIGYVELFAESILPLSSLLSKETIDLGTYIAFYGHSIPPENLVVTTEHMRYMKFGEGEIGPPAWAMPLAAFARAINRSVSEARPIHRWIVWKALRDGRKVPRYVLAEYPEIVSLLRRRGR